ncbi:MAG: carbamoyl-phosphate synthase large subunit [candidate division NC10 bacterium]|nr:carbamoyl-phosphate synthase large subunit [candidate division NC10 bacterium]
MPKRTDIEKILIIGSGPIVIGQACEFDYSGTQACKALREEGYQVILVNSNPATIMTDPEMADRTYLEPLTVPVVEQIIARERPDALLPTLGGQTGLNLAVALAEDGILDRYGVEMIGAKLHAIKKAEDRDLFKQAMQKIGVEVPESGYADSFEQARTIVERIGYPAIIRPSFTLGGTGASIAYNRDEFDEQVQWGLNVSPVHQILVEASVIGWKEFELEVMRDLKDNVVIICSIENFDPMGVHTGDSITVAPAQTLSDKEYQLMRDAAIAVIREIGVETGGSNIQFAVNPENGRMLAIEMNPRVSRSSALASKATGFPIAKIAAKLAVGYTLDEISNDITKETTACFEPTIDYCVVKFPRFSFEKFAGADETLTMQMKSVGEAMAIGRTFKEALQKVIRSLEIEAYGLEGRIFRDLAVRGAGREARDSEVSEADRMLVRDRLRVANWERVFYLADAFRLGMTVEEIHRLTAIDPWFLENIKEIVDFEDRVIGPNGRRSGSSMLRLLTTPVMREAKALGFSDRRLADLIGSQESAVRDARKRMGIEATFKMVDTCGAEFVAHTPYLYSTYEQECEANPTNRKKIIILGSGPNRIGQGIEFDYCCVHAAFALKEIGYETIMVNCNPETVSTDYDTSDRLYFEPLCLEDVLNITERERPDGVIVQFGGQTPLKLAIPLERAGVKILGTPPDAIDRAEDRERFKQMLQHLGLNQPPNGTAVSVSEALRIARQVGFPILVRPSYVLGGRAMEIIYNESSLQEYMTRAVQASLEHPVLVDKFLEDAIEMDVDALCDGQDVVIGGIMEHIEEAGVHSGDSACSLPPRSVAQPLLDQIRVQTKAMALELGVIGLINIQFAIKDGVVYVLEVNPRASRTVPFVSKAVGVPLAKLAAKIMAGMSLKELGVTEEPGLRHVAVKEAVLPFVKFPGVDAVLGPEMRSTGEVMGIDREFGLAFAKSQVGASGALPLEGTVFLSVRDNDKPHIVLLARRLMELGFQVVATAGTAAVLKGEGVIVEAVAKVIDGVRPHIVDKMKNGEIGLVINTPGGHHARLDSYSIRRTAVTMGIPYFTTMAAARAAVEAIQAMQRGTLRVKALQEYHQVRGT